MKRFSIWILLFLLCGCSYSITNHIYVASIHLNYNDDMFEANFYIINSLAIGLRENSENSSGDIATIKAKSISSLFNELDLTTSLDVNYMHISSIILNPSFLNYENLIELKNTVRDNNKIYYNSAIFVSEDDPKDIYNIKNPGKENDLFSIILSPFERTHLYLASSPQTLITFTRDLEAEKVLKIPTFSLRDCWNTEGANYYLDKVCYYYNNEYKIYNINDYSGLLFTLEHNNFLISDKNLSVNIKKLKIIYKFKDKLIINLKIKYKVAYSLVETKKYLKEYILNALAKLEEIEEDYLNLNYLNKQTKKEYTYDDIVYSLKL